jgi:hypothetical protein
MKVDGQCHCGELKFEAQIDPAAVRICHCTDCQTMSGTAYRVTVAAPAATFKIRSGQPKIYVKIAESGNERAHAFCANCGAQIYSAAVRDPPAYSVRVGTLSQRRDLPPKNQIWFRSALPWVTDLRDLPHKDLQQ